MKPREWRPNIKIMRFEALDSLDATKLVKPFLKEEVFKALLDLNGDKALGSNGFSMAFWQCC